MIITSVQLDTAAIMNAPPAEKIAIALSWRESFDMSNSQSLRDEFERAFWRQTLPYTVRSNPS